MDKEDIFDQLRIIQEEINNLESEKYDLEMEYYGMCSVIRDIQGKIDGLKQKAWDIFNESFPK